MSERWTPDKLAVAYDDELLKWTVSAASPIRAKIAVEMLESVGVPMVVEPIIVSHDEAAFEAKLVHDSEYVQRTVYGGLNDEWAGRNALQGKTAAHMFAGTVQLVDAMLRGRVQIGFTPQGAKHHAMKARGSGFCVLNDFAWAAVTLAGQGKKVLYIDLDAHHGDGVEALTLADTNIMTCSVHDSTIFPGTGHTSNPARAAYNWPLPRGAGDELLMSSVRAALGMAAEFAPDVVLIAVGGDGHAADPLSSLEYSYTGYALAAEAIGEFAAAAGAPVLMGGAGGYRPTDVTPTVWATFVATLNASYRAYQAAELVGADL